MSGSAAAGCNARSCYCRGARLPARPGRYRLNLGGFFKWTSLFILFVAAGLAAGAIRAFHEAGLWNHFQEIAFDMSAVLSTHSLFGTLMEGIFGYQEAPSVSEVAVWFIYLSRRWWHLLCHHAQGRQRLAPRNKYDANSCLVTTYFKGIVSS
ncbi:FTR1 family protein [Shigella flexneri]